MYGIVWGIGHATMLMIVAVVVMTLNLRIGDEFAWLMEFIVAIMLIFLALDLFRRLAKVKVHTHEHQHGTETRHAHVHVHMDATTQIPERHVHDHYEGYFGRALLVGLMHGSAGSAALILLVLQTINSKVLGVLYIILFGMGSTLGMVLLTAIISAKLQGSKQCSSELAIALRGLSTDGVLRSRRALCCGA